MKKIVFTGGGTGGHIFPILAVVRELKRVYPEMYNLEMYYIGPDDSYGLTLLANEGVIIKKIIAGKLRRYFSLKSILDILKFPIGTVQSFVWMFILAPDIIFSKGGYGSFAVALMGKIFAIPTIIHESDVSPGLATRTESKWAEEIFTSFPETEFFPKDKVIWVGNPTRRELLEGSKEIARSKFNLQGNKPLLLVQGGSQGAKIINETILEILPDLVKEFEVIHQIGERSFSQTKAEAEAVIFEESFRSYYHPFSFITEEFYKHALNAADLVISRAGSGSIFEIAAVGKPAILIPLQSSAGNHQAKNAYTFAKNGGAEVIEERNLTPYFLLETLKHLFKRPDLLDEMAKSSKEFARTKAAKIVSSYLSEYLQALSPKEEKKEEEKEELGWEWKKFEKEKEE